jgi:predicted ribosomally synthesized peptide with SipW-like signal peptide
MTATATRHPRAGGSGNKATKILASVAVLAFAGGIFTIASLALFTDQEVVGNNAFDTGTLDLVASDNDAFITMSAMVPGDEVTMPLTMTNSGTIELRYSAISVTTEATLAGELELSVMEGVSAANCTNAGWDTSGGTAIYDAGPLGTTTPGLALFGDNTAGQDSGDRVLAAGANEVLCFHVTLPTSATNASQNTSTTATFTFDAEQTANNA